VILVDVTTGERIVLRDRDERLVMRQREIPAEATAATRVLHVDGARHRRAMTSDLDRLSDRTEELIAAISIAIFAGARAGGDHRPHRRRTGAPKPSGAAPPAAVCDA
jgi:hypothetical protein